MKRRVKRLGLIALATDHAIETELRRFLPPHLLDICTTRIGTTDRYDESTLKALSGGLTAAARLLVPDSPLDVIAFGCTSGTIAIGEQRVFAHIADARPGVPCTTPITAALDVLACLRLSKLALLTPYPDKLHGVVAHYLTHRGIELAGQANLGIERDSEITDVPRHRLRQAVLALPWREAQAVFISCTSLRTAGLLQDLEEELGRPVISSNQALAWHCLQLAGLSPKLKRLGALMPG